MGGTDQPRAAGNTQGCLVAIGLIVAAGALLTMCTGGGGDNSGDRAPRETGSYSSSDPEYQLAAIDGASLTDAGIRPYATALDAAERLCEQGRREIGDMTVRAVELAEEAGGSETHLSMLRALNGSIPQELAPRDCADQYGTLILLMN